MKNLKILTVSLAVLFGTSALAQNVEQEETAKEVKMKSYTFYEDGKKVKNSVKITTAKTQGVMTKESEKDQVDQTRVIPPKTVVKTVEIDNDSDEAYDEIIEFSYITEAETDFTLVSDNENLMVAVDDGENLSILNNMTIAKGDLTDPKRAFVFTEDDGTKIKFFVKSYNMSNDKQSK